VSKEKTGLPLICLLAAWIAMGSARAEEWLAVAPEELQMKSDPKAPAAPAVYLYRQVDRDDTVPQETIYQRIKVLTDEGMKYADVQIPYLRGSEAIRFIQARTIRPDGTLINFDGEVYDKPIIKARGVKVQVKSFTLPDVQVGSIVEYRYHRIMTQGWVYNSRWLLSDELFTRHAKFSLTPSRDFALRWSWPMGLPPGTEPPKEERGAIRLETHDIPAFVTEEYMPPEDVVKYRVNFIYDADSGASDPTKYWKAYGKRRYREVESFIKDRRAMERAVAQIVTPDDSPAVKLRKIYNRTIQIRNVSFEARKPDLDAARDTAPDARDAEDVWTRGSGDATQITWLFLALVRAAGLEADPVLIPTRDLYFFSPKLMNPGELNSNAVIVKLGAGETYVDPGTPFTPFGLLPWHETAVSGLRLDKNGGDWVTTPKSIPSDSRIERKGTLRLANDASLEGKVTVSYTGLEASWRRWAERDEDATERQKFLEDDIKGDIPAGIEVKLLNTPDWTTPDVPLVAEYDLKVPGWAAPAGKRLLVPAGLFGSGEKHTFEHAARVHPLYFRYPYQHADDITVELPSGWQVSSAPRPRSSDLKVAAYTMAAEEANGALHLKRDLMLNILLADLKYYGALRGFFQTVRAGDEDQVIIAPGAAPGSH
jgi:hypothetical protein